MTHSAPLTRRSLAPSWASPRDLIARLDPASCGSTGTVWFSQRHQTSCDSTATPSLTASSRLGNRGCVTILDRAGLRRAAGDCYLTIRREFDKLR
jgi:hypothetical protein